jgi:hypothetical protein
MDAAGVKAVDKDGRTPLHNAAQSSSEDIGWAVRQLIEKGADVKAVDKDGRTPLHDIARSGSDLMIWAIRQLIEKGADVKAVDKDGRTPLHDAARSSSEDMGRAVRQLIEKGADVKAVDKDGRTPLYDAARSSSEVAILQILSDTPQDFDHSDGRALWAGLKTYRKCRDISDILTISRLNSPGHFFIARSVSGFLEEYYPAFGSGILNWISRICERSLQLDGSTSESPLNIGNPLLQTELHETYRKSTRGKVESRHISTKPTGIASIQETIVLDATYVRIGGHLETEQLIWEISTNSKEFAVEVKAALAWTLSVLQSPPHDAKGLFSCTPVSLDIGLPGTTEFGPTKTDSYCWTCLFHYVCIAELPSLRSPIHYATEGLEIDFHLLLELASVDRKIDTEDGSIFFGFDTALIPLAPPESRRWHFLVTNGRQITPARVKREFCGSRLQDKIGDDYTGNVYVGWCGTAVFVIGAKDSDTISVNNISMSSGVPEVKKYEESVERSSAKDASFLARIGFLGSSVGATGGSKKEKKFKLGPVVAKRTLQGNFEGILTSARTTPCILWDEFVKRSWLISASSVLLFASLRYVRWKRYSFKSKQDGQFQPATIHHANESIDPTTEAESALRRSQMLLVHEANGETVNDSLSFEDIVKQMWVDMSDGEDVCRSGTTGLKIEKKGYLIGYDMNEAICCKKKQLRFKNIIECMKSWQPLALREESQVIFCREIGDIVRCDSPMGSDDCCTQNCTEGALSCLFQDLRTFYGECWDIPPNAPAPQPDLGPLPIGQGYEWIPNCCYFLHKPEHNHCSKCLQSIVAKMSRNKKLQKQNLQKFQIEEGPKENGDKSLLSSPRRINHLIITFGSRTEGCGRK